LNGQTNSRHPPRSRYVPRDTFGMEGERPRDYVKDQVRKVSCPAHRQGHEGQRGPECFEPSTRKSATACVAACIRLERPRSAAHKPGCTTTTVSEPIPTLRRVRAKYIRSAIAQLLCTSSVPTTSEPTVRAYRVHTVVT
jgi:hypothetical protein